MSLLAFVGVHHSPPPFSPGDAFGGTRGKRYRIERHVFEGGQSHVFRALDTRLERPVAVKVSTATGAQRLMDLVRFERELKLSARVQHPHVVSVHDAGELPGGQPFMLLEWMPYGSLGAVVEHLRHRDSVLPARHVRY